MGASCKETAVETWKLIEDAGGLKVLKALRKVWYNREKLDPEEKVTLLDLFEQYPLGIDNFNKWMKQTLRQVFENSVRA